MNLVNLPYKYAPQTKQSTVEICLDIWSACEMKNSNASLPNTSFTMCRRSHKFAQQCLIFYFAYRRCRPTKTTRTMWFCEFLMHTLSHTYNNITHTVLVLFMILTILVVNFRLGSLYTRYRWLPSESANWRIFSFKLLGDCDDVWLIDWATWIENTISNLSEWEKRKWCVMWPMWAQNQIEPTTTISLQTLSIANKWPHSHVTVTQTYYTYGSSVSTWVFSPFYTPINRYIYEYDVFSDCRSYQQHHINYIHILVHSCVCLVFTCVGGMCCITHNSGAHMQDLSLKVSSIPTHTYQLSE